MDGGVYNNKSQQLRVILVYTNNEQGEQDKKLKEAIWLNCTQDIFVKYHTPAGKKSLKKLFLA